jgi:histidyl-tRNA synthetase
MQKERMKLCSELWAAGVRAEFGYKPNPNFKTDIVGFAQDQGIPVVVLFGEDELAKGVVNVKDMAAEEQVTVPRAEAARAVLKLLEGRPDAVL